MTRSFAAAAVLALLSAGQAWAGAGSRSAVYAEADLAVVGRPGLAGAWGAVPVNGDGRVGAGLWLGRRLAVFTEVGLLANAQHDTTPIGDLTQAPRERFRLLPLRVGLKLNLRPRIDWLEWNLVAAGSVVTGSHEYVSGNSVLGRESVFSLGVGAGVELTLTKFKRMGASLKVQYVLQPALLGTNQGFLAGGLTELGGLEVSLGWTVFIGGPSA